MDKNIVIVHFNTPELTTATVLSIRKHSPDCSITIFDNSDRLSFPQMDGVRYIDNTKGQIIDFDEFLSRFPKKTATQNNWGSAKHCYSIQKLWDFFPGGFVLMDSDVLVKRDISVFFDGEVAYFGECGRSADFHMMRLLPYICWINVPMCREYGIRYFDEKRSWKLRPKVKLYDTGASFLEDCEKSGLRFKQVKIDDFIEHFGCGSYKNKDYRQWLEKHKELYDMEETKPKTKTKAKAAATPAVKPQPKPTEDKYLVVIPYFAEGAQGRELEYAVAGWRRHFKEKYQIVVVGDYNPVVDTGEDITFIKCERVPEQPEKNYRPHIDFVKKFKAVRKAFPESKGFIFVADDCYAVNDFDIYDVKVLKQNGNALKVDLNRHSGFERDKKKTVDLLRREGYHIRNFTTHLPTWIEWDKLEALWEKYDMENESYIFEDLYFNIYYPNRIPLQLHIDYDNMKCGVYRRNPRIHYIERAFRTKIWIQNSVEGWIPELRQMLEDYYKV